jgi:DNA gyrase subunit A
MAQDFSLRYMLVDGQGNFGSVDGDSAAAMRYTEIRMAKISHSLLADLDKETVDYVENYDGNELIPIVLPTRIPNLLINGSSGIAVGMATNIPPHNLKEVIGGCLAYIDNTDITVDELMEHIPGPDFPTAAIINGKAGIVEAYRTGRGRIVIRAKAFVETNEKTGRETIVITELPYQLNKARLIERIAELVKEKKVEGISELRDESDKDGLRVVIEVKRGEVGEVVLNNLYAQTQLQNGFSFNVVALVDGQPQTLNLKEMIHHFVRHRREVVTRRTIYLLRKARDRVHILEGLAVAIANIDEIIELVKSSSTPVIAKDRLIATGWDASVSSDLMEKAGAASRPEDLDPSCGIKQGKYYLSPSQAKAILELKLHRLTGMEHDKLLSEYREKLDEIIKYLEILDNSKVLMQLIKEELQIVSDEFGDDRRTVIKESQHDLTVEDLISEEDRVVTISHSGYAKTQPLSDYQSQHRGGTGKSATAVKDNDFVEHLLIASTHSTILCFTNVGKVYWLKVYQIPVAGRNSKGRPMINLLPLDENERINSILPISEYDKNKYIIMATANGTVKKTSLDQYSRPRSVGLRAVDLVEGDYLVGSAITDGNSDVMLFSSEGKAVRFSESDVRSVGRVSKGVRGMRLPAEHKVLSMIIPADNGYALTVSASGYGKRTKLTEFPTKGRGGKGMIAMQASNRNGPLVGVVQLFDRDEIMLISDQGTMVRTRCDEISVLGRNTQGVRVIRLRDQEIMVGLARVEEQNYVDDFESED